MKAGEYHVTVENLRALIKKQPDNQLLYQKFMELLRRCDQFLRVYKS